MEAVIGGVGVLVSLLLLDAMFDGVATRLSRSLRGRLASRRHTG
jgi:hypothetical protein